MLARIVVVFLVGVVAAVTAHYSVTVTEKDQEPEASVGGFRSSIDTFDFDTAHPPTSVSTAKCERQDENCYDDQADFVQMCKQAYKGFVNGARCYFYAEGNTVWDDIFDKCAKKDAQAAQYHTAAEFDGLSNYLRSFRPWGEHIWTSIKRHVSATGHNSMPYAFTWWYKNAKQPYSRLSVANTWIRKHEHDDGFAGGQLCMVTFNNHDVVGDNPCTYQYPTTCVVFNKFQTFNYIKGQCLQETPIETYSSLSIDDCAKHCADGAIWCRSFNYYDDFHCELFSFVVSDTILNSNEKTNCFYYSYKG